MAVLLQQPRGDTTSHRSTNKNSSNNFASPDKTVASTPPNSPGFDTTNDADFARFETNVFQQQSNEDDGGSTGGDGLGPLPTTSSNTAALGGGGGGVVTGSKLSGTSSLRQPKHSSSPSRPRGSTKKILRVDKILCRVPSHESNISDLSASLSPTGPRGPGPMGRGTKDALTSRGPKSKDGELTIMASLLNDCAVFESVNDLLTVVNGGESPPPPPPPQPTQKKNVYEKPNVWGLAPDDDDVSDSPVKKSRSNGEEVSVEEYDNVELVLDESAMSYSAGGRGGDSPVLTPNSSDSGRNNLKKFMGGSSKSKDGNNNTSSPPLPRSPSISDVLKNKLSLRKKAPSPATLASVSSGPQVMVVEKNDPRISHMYDIAQFDNEELMPTVGDVSPGGLGGSEKNYTNKKMKETKLQKKGLASDTPFNVKGNLQWDDMICQPVGTAPGTSEEVEIDEATMLKSQPSGENSNKKSSSTKGAGKLLKGLSLKSKKSENKKAATSDKGVDDQPKYPTSRSQSLGRQSSKKTSSAPAANRSKDDLHLSTPPLGSSTPIPTSQQIQHAKKWKATFDKSSNKYYYYHRETREVTWEKPLGYDEANRLKMEEKKGAEKSTNDGKEKENKVNASGDNKASSSGKSDWRATLDATTKKTYYYNKKTKEVSWTKPPGFDGDTKQKKKVEETQAMASVADKRKKSAWFKKKSSDKEEKVNNKMSGAEKSTPESKAAENKEKPTNDDENVDYSKYWRATQDASGKTYYFNKKTKMVTWDKPEGFVEKQKAPSDEKKNAEKKDTSASEQVKTTENASANPSESSDTNQAAEQSRQVDDESEIEGFTEAEAIDASPPTKKQVVISDEDAPFDEPDTPFDEPEPVSPKRAHFEQPPKLQQSDDVDDDEAEDSFDESDLSPGQPLYGRVKSLNTIDFKGRNSTFTSHMTDTTRKAANISYGANDSSLNNSISSEIFTDDRNETRKSQEEQDHFDSRGANRSRGLSQMPPTPPRNSSARQVRMTSSNNNRGSSNRRYSGKRAENLGDSSADESSEVQQQQEDSSWDDDEVSALSGIGNESIESKKKRRDARRNRSGGDGQGKRSSREDKSSTRPDEETTIKPPQSDTVKEWTKQELDSFISKNDWGSVSKYINEMRVSKGSSFGGNNRPEQVPMRKEPSIQEIQERIEYNRSLEQESSMPKKRFGARSQTQHEELSEGDSPSAGVESESVWQSLSSASYVSEESSQYYRQQRRGSRKRASPKELMM